MSTPRSSWDPVAVGTWVFDTSPASLSMPGRGRLVGTDLELNPTDDTGAQVDPPPWTVGDVVTISTLVLRVAADPVKVDTYWRTVVDANQISLGPQLRLDVAYAAPAPASAADELARRLDLPTPLTPDLQQLLEDSLTRCAALISPHVDSVLVTRHPEVFLEAVYQLAVKDWQIGVQGVSAAAADGEYTYVPGATAGLIKSVWAYIAPLTTAGGLTV